MFIGIFWLTSKIILSAKFKKVKLLPTDVVKINSFSSVIAVTSITAISTFLREPFNNCSEVSPKCWSIKRTFPLLIAFLIALSA